MKTNMILRVAKNFELPAAVATHRNALLGMSGAGKSNASVVLAEEMHSLGIPWVAIDPKGDWYGIRSSSNGKGPGLDVPVIGGEFGDIPLHVGAGKRLGELAATGKLRGVIDTSEFESNADQSRFMADFGRALLRHCRKPLHVFCDECDEYMPQPGAGGRLEGPAAECVGVWKLVARRGRQKGIGFTLASQRTALVNKTCLYQCETLIAMRMVGKHDKAAIESWLAQIGDAKELLKSLPLLEDGEAWVWSPQRLKVMQRVTFRRRATFDSGRTPEIGEALVVPKMAALDLKALRAELEAEAPASDDPGELRKRIAELERRLKAEQREPERVAVPVFDAARFESLLEFATTRMQEAIDSADAHRTKLIQARGDIGRALASYRADSTKVAGAAAKHPLVTSPRLPVAIKPGPAEPLSQKRDASGNGTAGKMPGAERKILTVLAQHGGEATKRKVALVAGYAIDGGGFKNALGALRSKGWIAGSEVLRILDPGSVALGPVDPLPTGADLLSYWCSNLGKAERSILEALADAQGKLAKAATAKRAGYEVNGGGFKNALGRLRTLQLITGSDELVLSEELFG